MMQGHQLWLKAGKKIGTCDAIEAEAKDYYESQSTVDMWVVECCSVESVSDQPGRYWAQGKDLYCSYRQWKQERGEIPQSMTRFGGALATRYPKMTAGGARYKGLLLKPQMDRD